jgi:hypothetical protein
MPEQNLAVDATGRAEKDLLELRGITLNSMVTLDDMGVNRNLQMDVETSAVNKDRWLEIVTGRVANQDCNDPPIPS